MKIAIDSGASRLIWERMYSKNSRSFTSRSPIIEFGYRYVRFLYSVIHEFSGADTAPLDFILCMDPLSSATLFRQEVIDKYYNPNKLKVIYDPVNAAAGCCVAVDGKFINVYWSNTASAYQHETITKLKAAELLQNDHVPAALDQLELGVSTYVLSHVKPRYKFGRVWKHAACTKEAFKELRYSAGKKAAFLLNMQVWEDPRLEADDLLYRVAKKYPNEKVVVISGDSDSHQIALCHDDIQIFRTDKKRYVEETRTQIAENLWVKLLCGEPAKGSDNIKPTLTIKGAPLTNKPATAIAKKVMQVTGGPAAQLDYLYSTVDRESFEKNVKMILLKAAPMPAIGPCIPRMDHPITLSDMYVSKKEMAAWHLNLGIPHTHRSLF